jgi:hypothetical protein
MEWLTELPDGFWELTEPVRGSRWGILLTLTAIVIIAGGGLVAARLRTAEGAGRWIGRLAGLGVLVVAIALAVWWVGLGVPVAVILLTGVGVVLAAGLGFLAATLLQRPARGPKTFGGLLALGALGSAALLLVWWTFGVVLILALIAALWTFGGGLRGVVLMGGSFLLVALFCALAYRLRATQGWLSAFFGAMAVLLALWWLIGIVPSAWIYFVDAQEELLANQLIPSEIVIGGLDVATDFMEVFRDSIVVVEGAVVLALGVVVMRVLQKRLPGGLAEGEERGPTTGGYK